MATAWAFAVEDREESGGDPWLSRPTNETDCAGCIEFFVDRGFSGCIIESLGFRAAGRTPDGE